MTSEYTRLKLHEKKITSVNYRLLWNDFAFMNLTHVSTRTVTHPLRLWQQGPTCPFLWELKVPPFLHFLPGRRDWSFGEHVLIF